MDRSWRRGIARHPGFEPGLLLNLIETEQAAEIGAVPTMLMAMMEHPDLVNRVVMAFVRDRPMPAGTAVR